jgi:hypothetical protein
VSPGRVAFGPSRSELYRHRLVLTSTETRLDGSSFDSEVDSRFHEQDGKTLMTLVQQRSPTVELRDEHRVGLPDAFDRFELAVRARARSDSR